LTVYIEIAITADCKLLPWQQLKLMWKYVLSSCVAKVTGHIFLVLHIDVGLISTPICKMIMIYRRKIPGRYYSYVQHGVALWLVIWSYN